MRLLFTFIILAVIIGCSNEFEVLETPREIPAVYAIIDPADENQYFKIERVFSQDGESGLDLAKDPAQLYFDDITVKLLKGNEEKILTRVNGEDEGLPREEDGVFASTPNVLYKISTEDLDAEAGDEVTLSIEGVYEDRAVTSTTTLIEQPFFVSPSELALNEGKKRRINWTAKDGNEIFTVSLLIDVVEVNTMTNEQNPVELEWVLQSATVLDDYEIIPIEFYQFMGAAFDEDPNLVRFLGNARFQITAGDINIADIKRVSGANLGITSSGEVPVFSNLSEGLGLFASKSTNTTEPFPISGDTKDSLRNGRFTEELNFQ